MNMRPWERGHHPSSEEYVKSYVKFYASRMGRGAVDSINGDGTDEISITAKTHLVDDLYKNLDTLDSKAGAILTFCGVVLASIAIMISINDNVKYIPILYILFVSVTVSSVLALTVINVHWSTAKEIGHRTLSD